MSNFKEKPMEAPGRKGGSELSPVVYRNLVIALYAAAFLLRLWRYLCGIVNHDTAICGLLGLDILRGKLPLFFWGQEHMGSLDGYLAAPIYALLGPSSLTLSFLPFIFSLGLMAVTHLTLRRLFSPVGVLAGLAFLALPPALLLFYGAHAVTHYPIGIFISALLIYLSVRMWQGQNLNAAGFFLWGFLAGLGLWTNFMTAVAVFPCALFLFCTRFKNLLRPALAWAFLGGVIGGLPLLYYNLTHGLPHLGQAKLLGLHYLAKSAPGFFLNALPIVLGLHTPATLAGLAPGGPWFWGYLAVLALALTGATALAAAALKPAKRIFWLFLLIAAVNILLVTGSDYSRKIMEADVNYFLPVFLVMPMVWAALAVFLARRSQVLAWVFVGCLLALQISVYPGYRGGVLLSWPPDFRTRIEPGIQKFLKGVREQGFTHLYTTFSHKLNTWPQSLAFFADGHPVVAHIYKDRRAFAAAAVDAHPSPAFFAEMQKSLDFLGRPYRSWQGMVYHGVKEPPQGLGLLDGSSWQARTLSGRNLHQVLNDGKFNTGWQAPAKRTDSKGFVLDLKRTETLAGLALVPGRYTEVPAGIRVEAAGPDGRFGLIRQVTDYWGPLYFSGPHPFLKIRYGRVECYFDPRPVRYLKITHLGNSPRPFSVREILLMGPDFAKNPASWQQSARLALKKIKSLGLEKIYADAWLSAWLRVQPDKKLRTLPANSSTDDYGADQPPAGEPLVLAIGPKTGLAVTRGEAPAALAALQKAGVDIQRHEAGRFVLLSLKPSRRGERLGVEKVFASVNAQAASALAQGSPPGGRWSSGGPQRPEMSLTLDLGRKKEVGWVELGCPNHPQDYPRALRAKVSQDGQDWKPAPLKAAGPLIFTGKNLLASPGSRSLYRLGTPVKTRYLRLSLAALDPVYWWSVESAKVFSP